jgi:phage repressor protein C with HTH and peptisase S24 domain
MTQSTQQERFKYMREEILNLTQAQLAEKLKVKQPTVADIESGRKQKIDTNILYKLVLDYLINTEWLLFGTGDITKIDTMERHQFNEATECNKNIIPIPFYSAKAAAGKGTTLHNAPKEDVLYFDERWLKNILGVNPKNLHLIMTKGDSMDSGFNTKSDIKDGDLLLVDTSVLDGNNKVFVILINNSELRVKRLIKKLDGTLIVISDNSKYPQEVYEPDNVEIEIKVIGKVVWNGSKENI